MSTKVTWERTKTCFSRDSTQDLLTLLTELTMYHYWQQNVDSSQSLEHWHDDQVAWVLSQWLIFFAFLLRKPLFKTLPTVFIMTKVLVLVFTQFSLDVSLINFHIWNTLIVYISRPSVYFLPVSLFPGLEFISWLWVYFLAASWPWVYFLAVSSFPGHEFISWLWVYFLALSVVLTVSLFPDYEFISWPFISSHNEEFNHFTELQFVQKHQKSSCLD